MVTSAFTSGIDSWYPLRIVAAVLVLWAFRTHYAALVRSWSWSWWPVLFGAITFIVWIALSPLTQSGVGGWAGVANSQPLVWIALWAAFHGVGYVLVTPIVEELAFRAFLLQRLEESPVGRFSWAALLISSMFFGALHGQMWIAGILAGLAFSVAFYRRRMVADAVMSHGVANALLAVYASTTRQWGVWS
jgi:CAAX prenyl protease-like protein